MTIDIQSVHFSPGRELLSFIDKKAKKLFRLDDTLISFDVYLKIERAASHENKVAEVRIHSSNGDCFAKKRCDTFEHSINLTFDALRKQLLKIKKK